MGLSNLRGPVRRKWLLGHGEEFDGDGSRRESCRFGFEELPDLFLDTRPMAINQPEARADG